MAPVMKTAEQQAIYENLKKAASERDPQKRQEYLNQVFKNAHTYWRNNGQQDPTGNIAKVKDACLDPNAKISDIANYALQAGLINREEYTQIAGTAPVTRVEPPQTGDTLGSRPVLTAPKPIQPLQYDGPTKLSSALYTQSQEPQVADYYNKGTEGLGDVSFQFSFLSPLFYRDIKASMLAFQTDKLISPEQKMYYNALVELVFSSEESYSKFLLMNDTQRQDYLKMWVTKTYATTTGKVTDDQMIVIAAFLSAYSQSSQNIGKSRDQIVNAILNCNLLTDTEKQGFKQMFATLFMIDNNIGEAFLAAVYSAVSAALKDPKMSRATFDSKLTNFFNYQKGLLAAAWGPEMGAIADSIWNKTGITRLEKFMDILYLHLSLGTLLGAKMQTTAWKAFATATTAAYAMFINTAIVGNLSEVEKWCKRSLGIPEDFAPAGYTGTGVAPGTATPEGKVPTIMFGANITAPITILIGALAKAGADVTSFGINAYANIVQLFMNNLGAATAKSILKAYDKDRNLNMWTPMAAANIFGFAAIYGIKQAGIKGVSIPVASDIVAPATSGTGVPAVTNYLPGFAPQAVDKDFLARFDDALSVAGNKDTNQVAGQLLGMQAFIYSLDSYPTQELDRNAWEFVFVHERASPSVISKMGKMSEAERCELFDAIVYVNQHALVPMSEMMRAYRKGGAAAVRALAPQPQ